MVFMTCVCLQSERIGVPGFRRGRKPENQNFVRQFYDLSMPSWRHLDASCKHLEASGVSSCELGGCFLGHPNPNLDLIRNHNSNPVSVFKVRELVSLGLGEVKNQKTRILCDSSTI